MTRQSYPLRIIIIFGSVTGKNDRLRIIRGLKFQGRAHIHSRSRGWGGEGTAFFGSKRLCYHCVTVFSYLSSCTGPGAPNENIVQNQLNIALLNVF